MFESWCFGSKFFEKNPPERIGNPFEAETLLGDDMWATYLPLLNENDEVTILFD